MKISKKIISAMALASCLCFGNMETSAEPIPISGIVEGFYGRPWTHENRIDMIKFCGAHGFNAYIYAPKDDPYHRAKWREPYPEEKLKELTELVKVSKENGVKFIFALSPGLDYKTEEYSLMIDKLTAMYDIGVRDFAIFFDDIEDKDATSQAQVLNMIEGYFVQTHTDISPLITVPTEYFYLDMVDENKKPKNYTKIFSEAVNPEISVLYTGNGVVCPGISDAEYKTASEVYHHRDLGIWWNYPVNDYTLTSDGERNAKLALGAIENLPKNEKIPAIFFNPMNFEQLSKISLATGADYAKDPENYNPRKSWEKAIEEQFGDLSEEMKIFADQSQHLENNWAKVGSEDGAELRAAFDKLLNSNDAEFEENFKIVEEKLNKIHSATKKLQSKLPKNILSECKPQLKQLERLVDADMTAMKILRSRKQEDNKEVKRLENDLRKKLRVIVENDKTALISQTAARAFIDKVLNLL